MGWGLHCAGSASSDQYVAEQAAAAMLHTGAQKRHVWIMTTLLGPLQLTAWLCLTNIDQIHVFQIAAYSSITLPGVS
jgi:hypothetical protein